MQPEILIAFITASALLTIMPGPDNIYVLMQSITNGKKFGIVTALGLATGIIVHTSLVAFGVSEILKKSENIFFAIKLLGAIYLFYLAFKVYKSSAKIELDKSNISDKNLFLVYKQGFVMNVLNPKVTIFFLAFFPGFVDNSLGNVKQQIFILGFVFMLLTIVIFSAIALLASKMTSFLRDNQKFEKNLRIIQIIVFIGIGVFILF
jgi:threonine/homoserine/homoserine lactone efflux protein